MIWSAPRGNHTRGQQHWQPQYFTGLTTFKLVRIKDHKQSTLHKHCMKIAHTKKGPSQTDGAQLVKSLMQQHTEKMILLFPMAHALAKKARPYSGFFLVWRRQIPCIFRFYHVMRRNPRWNLQGLKKICFAVIMIHPKQNHCLFVSCHNFVSAYPSWWCARLVGFCFCCQINGGEKIWNQFITCLCLFTIQVWLSLAGLSIPH